MMVQILEIPELGKLEIIEVYEYYDQPVLFSCKNAADHLYLYTFLCTITLSPIFKPK